MTDELYTRDLMQIASWTYQRGAEDSCSGLHPLQKQCKRA